MNAQSSERPLFGDIFDYQHSKDGIIVQCIYIYIYIYISSIYIVSVDSFGSKYHTRKIDNIQKDFELYKSSLHA